VRVTAFNSSVSPTPPGGWVGQAIRPEPVPGQRDLSTKHDDVRHMTRKRVKTRKHWGRQT
jgi:hypothetical protein